MIDLKVNRDLCVTNLTVITKERFCKFRVDHTQRGRWFDGFLYLYEGEAVFYIDNKTYKAMQGELVFIPRGSVYKMQYTSSRNVFTLIDCKIFDNDRNDLRLFDEITIINDSCDGRVRSVMDELNRYANDMGVLGYFKRKELVFRLLGFVFNSVDGNIANNRLYARLINGEELLKRTYLSSLPISEYAKASNLSESGFRSLFFQKYKMSPVKYRNLLRINKAIALLNKGEYSVKEVCFECGFENVGYFCRYYKKITGETPQETKNKFLYVD